MNIVQGPEKLLKGVTMEHRSNRCPQCGKFTDEPQCPSCGYIFELERDRGRTYHKSALKDYLDVPYLHQKNNTDCSEVVANMIHKWRGEEHKMIPEDVNEFGFHVLADNVGGRLESGDMGEVKKIVMNKDQPVPIRLRGMVSGHTVLVIGSLPNGYIVIHDPDERGNMRVQPDTLDYTGYYIDLTPEKPLNNS